MSSSTIEVHLQAYDSASSVFQDAGNNIATALQSVETATQNMISQSDSAASQISGDFGQICSAASGLDSANAATAQSVNSLSGDIGGMGQSLASAASDIDSAGNSIVASLQSVETETQGVIDKADSAASQVTADYGQISGASAALETANGVTAAGSRGLASDIGSLGGTMISAASTIEGMETMQYRLDKAHVQVEKSARSVESAQDAYNAAVSKFGENSPQAIDAAGKLAIAQDTHNLAVERANQLSVQQGIHMASLAMDIVPQMISAVGAIIGPTEGATAAQWDLNTAEDTCPLMAVISLISLLVTALFLIPGALGAVVGAFTAAGNAIVGFCSSVGGAITSWWNGATGASKGVEQSQKDLETATAAHAASITAKYDDLTTQIDTDLGKLKDSIATRYAGIEDLTTEHFKTDYDAFIKYYEDILNPPKTALDTLLADVNTHYDKIEKADTAFYTQEKTDTDKYYDGLIADVQTKLQQQESTINSNYTTMSNDIKSKYADDLANTEDYYDSMIGAVNKGLSDIQHARSGDLDALELTMLQSKEKIKTDHDAGLTTDKEYQAALSALQTQYSSDRSTTQDTYRLQELTYEKDHHGQIETLTQQKSDALKTIQTNENAALLDVDNQKHWALQLAQNAANAETIKTRHNQQVVLTTIATAEGNALAGIEQEKNDLIAGIKKKDFDLQAGYAQAIATLETNKNNEIYAATSKAEDDKAFLIKAKEDEINGIMTNTEELRVQIIQNSMGRIQDLTNATYTNITSVMGDRAKDMQDSLSKAADSSAGSMGKVKDAVDSNLSDASKSIDTFKANVCFAHALENAAASSQASMNTFTAMMNTQMSISWNHIRNFIGICVTQFGSLGTLVSSAGDTFKAFVTTIGNALLDASGRSAAAMQNWVNMLRSSLDQGLSAIANFNASICFAHGLAKAVDDSESTMKKWNTMVKDALTTGVNDIKSFNAQASLSGAATGLSGVSSLAAKPSVTITGPLVAGPLVNIEGSADRKTIDAAVSEMKNLLKSVIIEATSAGAPATSKRIRKGSTF
jgi:hypothetical protein